MPILIRLRLPLVHAVCLAGLAVGVPAIATAVAPEPAEARAGGSYGSSSSSRSSSSGYRSSSSGYRSSSSSRSRYRSSGSAGDIGMGGVFTVLLLMGAVFVGGLVLMSASPKNKGGGRETARPRQWETLTVLQADMAKRDPAWEEANLLAQARESYMAIQHAWVRRDQDLAKSEMTPELYARHKAQTDGMIARGEVAVLQNLEITSARLVHASDYLDDSRDEAWIKFSARAIDYMMSEQTGKVLKGRKDDLSVFTEIWKFRRDGANWMAAEIVPNADIFVPQSYSQAASA